MRSTEHLEGMQSNRDYYDRMSVSYESSRQGRYHEWIDDRLIDLCLPWARGKEVLEVGVGTGRILGRLQPSAADVRGVDLSRGMLESAARTRPALRDKLIEAGAETLPFDDASFDLALSFKTLPHVRERGRALEEIARVLRPGGRAFVEFYNRLSLRYLVKYLRGPAYVAPNQKEDQVYLRWDWPWQLPKELPASLRVRGAHGFRILTLSAGWHEPALMGKVLRWAEDEAAASFLRRCGGFYVLELEKTR